MSWAKDNLSGQVQLVGEKQRLRLDGEGTLTNLHPANTSDAECLKLADELAVVLQQAVEPFEVLAHRCLDWQRGSEDEVRIIGYKPDTTEMPLDEGGMVAWTQDADFNTVTGHGACR